METQNATVFYMNKWKHHLLSLEFPKINFFHKKWKWQKTSKQFCSVIYVIKEKETRKI